MVKLSNQNYMLVASSLYFVLLAKDPLSNRDIVLLAKDPLSNRDISCTQTLSIEFRINSFH